MTEDLEEEEELQGLHLITLMFSEDDSEPQIDLGDVNPWFAVTLFQHAAEAISLTLRPPKVIFNGTVIMESVMMDDDDD